MIATPMRRVHEQRACTILHHLLRARRPGGRWLLPANVCPIVPLVFRKTGTPFELVDIDEELFCLDALAAAGRIGAGDGPVAGILVVRTYGVDADFGSLFAALRRLAPGALLVDDRCLCPPAFDPPGAGPADVVLFSTGYAKPVDLGRGGFAFLGAGVGYRAGRLAFRPADLEAVTAAYKAAVAAGRPYDGPDGDWLDTSPPAEPFDRYRASVEREWSRVREHKRRLNAIYAEGVPADCRLADRHQGWRFHLRVPDKQALIDTLFEHGLFASSHYADLGPVFGDREAPRARALHASVVNLFNDRYYTEEQARRTAELVRDHLRRRGLS